MKKEVYEAKIFELNLKDYTCPLTKKKMNECKDRCPYWDFGECTHEEFDD